MFQGNNRYAPIECNLIGIQESKTLQQVLHSFLHAQERTKEGHPSNLLFPPLTGHNGHISQL